MPHAPVLLKEVLDTLHPQPGEFFIDGTFGGGGHAQAIIGMVGKSGKLLAIDADARAVENCKEQITKNKEQIACVQDNFVNLARIIASLGWGKADGLLLDLGLSSDEIETSGRGFTFQKNEPLLMTLNDKQTPLYELLPSISEEELEKILRDYSGERYAGRIAHAIKNAATSITTTKQLREVIFCAVPKNYEHGRIDPATRTFLALRIYTNHEFENLEKLFLQIHDVVKSGARIAVITFHSSEDRVMKNIFRDSAKRGELTLINKKVIVPQREEILRNPRSRSAKLRAAIIV